MCKKIMAVLMLLMVTACAAPLSKNYKFDGTSEHTLAVMDINYAAGKKPILSFRKYVPSTGELLEDSKTVNLTQDLRVSAGEVNTVVFDLEPGHWFLSHATLSDGGYPVTNQTRVSLASGTIAFEAKVGEAIYLGNIGIGQFGGINMKQPDIAGAQQELQEYRRISVPLKPVETLRVTYTCQKDPRSMIGIKIKGCYAEKLNISH